MPSYFAQLYPGLFEKETEEPGFTTDIGRGIGQIISTTGSTLRDIGAPDVGEAIEMYGEDIVRRRPAEIQSLSDVFESPLTTVREAVGEMVPQVGAAGVGALGGRFIGGLAGIPFGPAGVAVGQQIGGTIGGLVPIAAQTYGGVRAGQREKGIEDIPLALGVTVPAVALERLGAERLVTRLATRGRAGVARDAAEAGTSLFRYAGREFVRGALVEGPLTEVPQTALERVGTYDELTTPEAFEEYGLAGIKGAAGGGVIRGGLAFLRPDQTLNALSPQAAPPADTTQVGLRPSPSGPMGPGMFQVDTDPQTVPREVAPGIMYTPSTGIYETVSPAQSPLGRTVAPAAPAPQAPLEMVGAGAPAVDVNQMTLPGMEMAPLPAAQTQAPAAPQVTVTPPQAQQLEMFFPNGAPTYQAAPPTSIDVAQNRMQAEGMKPTAKRMDIAERAEILSGQNRLPETSLDQVYALLRESKYGQAERVLNTDAAPAPEQLAATEWNEQFRSLDNEPDFETLSPAAQQQWTTAVQEGRATDAVFNDIVRQTLPKRPKAFQTRAVKRYEEIRDPAINPPFESLPAVQQNEWFEAFAEVETETRGARRAVPEQSAAEVSVQPGARGGKEVGQKVRRTKEPAGKGKAQEAKGEKKVSKKTMSPKVTKAINKLDPQVFKQSDIQRQIDEAEAGIRVDPDAPQSETIKAKPGVDVQRLTKILGPKLYGDPKNQASVSVKEMLQNGFDAIKTLIDNGTMTSGKIDIKVDEDTRIISVLDNGSGMVPEILGTKFLEIAGTQKETERGSGGLGIAKMLFLFGSQELSVVTMRDGKVSVLNTSGPQLFESFENPDKRPDIEIRNPTSADRAMFPDGHGTYVEVKVPESYIDPTTDEEKEIDFEPTKYDYPVLENSPLFSNIDVTFNGSTVQNMGSEFPAGDYTQFADVQFPWGTAKIYVSASDAQQWGENIHFLSNGLWQFSERLQLNPGEFYGDLIPRRVYVDVQPKVKAEEAGYPFALNRQQFTPAAATPFQQVKNYLSVFFQQADFTNSAVNFGDFEYLTSSSVTKPINVKSTGKQKLEPVAVEKAQLKSEINAGSTVRVEEGKLIVDGRVIPVLSPDDIKNAKIDVDELKVDPALIDTNSPMVHDNVEIEQPDGSYESIVTLARNKFGERFDNLMWSIGNTFLRLRRATASELNYDKLDTEAIGISFDKEYRGVSIRVPFSGSFINPAVPEYMDTPRKAAVGMLGTMIHELAHHQVRSHNANFAAEMQRISIVLDDSQALNFDKLRKDFIKTVNDDFDILLFLNDEVTSGRSRTRGQRFKDVSAEQIRPERFASDVDRSRTAAERRERLSQRTGQRTATAQQEQLSRRLLAQDQTARDEASIVVGRPVATQRDSDLADLIGAGVTGRQLLDFIGKTSKSEYVRLLAQRLRNFQVNPTVTFADPARMVFNNEQATPANVVASYNPAQNIIRVYSPVDLERVVMHEMIHAATERAIKSQTDSGKKLRELFQMTKKAFGNRDYAFTNESEFIAEALTNVEFQKFLRSLAAPTGSKFRDAWEAFKGYVRRWLNLPQATDSTFDRLMDLTPSLMQENVTAPRPGFETDAELPAIAMPAKPQMQESLRDFAEKLNPARYSKFRRATLGLRFLRDIKDNLGGQLDGLRSYVDQAFAMGASTNTLLKGASQISNKWASLGEEMGTKLNEVAALATYSELHPDIPLDQADHKSGGKDLSNRHLFKADGKLSDPETENNYRTLEAQWNGLSPAAKQVYFEARNFMRDNWQKRQALLNKQIDAVFAPLIADAKRVNNQSKVKGLEKERTQYIREFGRQLAQVRGPYFPLMRFGNYFVVYKSQEYRARETELEVASDALTDLYNKYDIPTTLRKEIDAANRALVKAGEEEIAKLSETAKAEIAEARKRVREAQAKVDKLTREGEKHYANESFESQFSAEKRAEELGTDVQLSEEYFRELNPINKGFLDKLSSAVGAALPEGQALKAREAMVQIFLASLPQTSALKNEIRRKGVAGFSRDMQRAFSAYSQKDAHYLSRLEYMDEMTSDLLAMRRASKGAGLRKQELYNEMARRHVASLQYNQSPIEDGLASLAFIYQLGISPAFLLTNLSQPWMVSMPFMSARHNVGKVTSELGKAFGEVGKAAASSLKKDGIYFEIDLNKFSGTEKTMLETAMAQGLLDITLEVDIGGYAKGGTGPINRVTRALGVAPHQIEVINRVMTALAAYRLEKSKGSDEAASTDYALRVLDKTHLDYSSTNAPYWLKPGVVPLGKLLFQYRKFQLGMITLMANQTKQLFSKDPVTKAEAKRALIGLFGVHALMTGAVGLPAVGSIFFIANLVNAVFGDEDEPWDAEVEFRRYIAEAFGVEAGAVVAKGLPMLMGVDLSRNVGLGDIAAPIRVLRADSKEGRDLYLEVLAATLGPTIGGLGPQFADGIQAFANGDLYRGAEGVTPRFMRDIIRAARLTDEGLTTKSGSTVFKPEDIASWDVALQALGVPSRTLSERSAAVGAVEGAKRDVKGRREELTRAYVKARRSSDQAALARIQADIREFNAARRARDEPQLKVKDLIQSFKNRQQYQQEVNPQGVRLTKAERAFGAYGEFASVR